MRRGNSSREAPELMDSLETEQMDNNKFIEELNEELLDEESEEEHDEFGNLLDDEAKKVRKPYTITKSRESWNDEEHNLFLEALSK